ncbi:uncharacterized protein KRP23_25 [Phytophthora ramorum]|uniref:uncharacterized protein n=1 Tax=Phytophthora ramorum TaxID=164328 RepID=UPI00309FA39C|nr:hypothetical protein KRP23_25 [Phytophthora ramorum]
MPADNTETMTARFQTTASIAALILSPLASVATTWVRLYYVQSMTLVLVALASLLLSFSLTSRPILSMDIFATSRPHILPGWVCVHADDALSDAKTSWRHATERVILQ